MDNHVTVGGNITREPEIRYTPSGATVASFGIAVNRRWKNKQTDQWDEQTSFFDVKCWGQLAENVVESCPKGTRVTVIGRLEQQSWEDRESGAKRSKVEIVADDVCPSLKWATCQVTRIERAAQGQAPTAPAKAPAQQAYTNEEPF